MIGKKILTSKTTPDTPPQRLEAQVQPGHTEKIIRKSDVFEGTIADKIASLNLLREQVQSIVKKRARSFLLICTPLEILGKA